MMQEVQNLIPGLPDEIALECLIRVPYKYHSEIKSVCHGWQNLISSFSFYEERIKSGTAEHLVCQVQPLPPPKDSSSHFIYDCAGRITSSKKEEDEQFPGEYQNQNNQQHQQNQQIRYGLTIFNASNQTWERMNPKNLGKIPMFCQCVAIPASRKLLLLGGWDPTTLEPVADVYVLDMAKSSRWRRAAPMSVARSFFACAVVGSTRVYVAGGHDNQKNALKSAEVYDVEADEWKILPEMEEERDECLGLSWEGDDKFWVVSGYGTESQGRFKSDAECYDPDTGIWSKIDTLWPFQSISPRGNTAAVTSNAQQKQWLWFLTTEQQQLLESQQQQENEGKKGKFASSIVQLPNVITGTSSCVTVTTLGICSQNYGKHNQNSQQQQQQKFFVMTGNVAGEGGFILEKERGGNMKWNHVQIPVGFSGFPYSSSYLLI